MENIEDIKNIETLTLSKIYIKHVQSIECVDIEKYLKY